MTIEITGIGSYIPEIIVKNKDFESHIFLNDDGSTFEYPNTEVIDKFKNIINGLTYKK